MKMNRSAPGCGCWYGGLLRSTVGAIVALAVVPAVFALAGSSFEIDDGNLVVDGATDWETHAGSPALKIGVDEPTGQTDDSLTGKEDNTEPGITL